jgi:hypothetical protein
MKYNSIEHLFGISEKFGDFTTDFLTKMTNLMIPSNPNISPKTKQMKNIKGNKENKHLEHKDS